MKVRFVQACVIGHDEYEYGAVHDLEQPVADLALGLGRAVPYVEPVEGSEGAGTSE